MKQTDKIKETIKELMTKTTDEDLLNGLADLNKQVDDVEGEYKELEDKHVTLFEKYRTAVVNASFKPDGKEDQTRGGMKARSLEEIATEFYQNKAKQGDKK